MRFVLAATVAFAATSPIFAAEQMEGSKAKQHAATINPMVTLNLEDLSTTRERPLFSRSRRPLIVSVSPPAMPEAGSLATAPEFQPFELLGAVLGQSVSYILVRNRNTHEVKRLSRTEEADGWTVAEVNPRSAILEHDGRIEKLTLGDVPAPSALSAPQSTGSTTALTTSKRPGADQIARTASPVDAEYDRLMKKLNIH